MWIVRLALRRPYTFTVMALLIVILGVVAGVRMPKDIFPSIDIPVVTVIWMYPGLTPIEMERRVVTISERSMTTTVNDIQHIESTSLLGVAIIHVYFQPGASIDAAVAQVSSANAATVRTLPPGITPPFVLRYSASSVPVIQLGVSSDDLTEQAMYDLAYNFIRVGLATVQGAAVPVPSGGKVRQIQVDLNPARLQSYGLSPTDVSNAINAQNLILPTGTVKVDTREYGVVVNSSPQIVAALNDLPIRRQAGSTVYIRDVAQVRDGNAPQTSMVRQNGVRGVLMPILKSGNASTLDIIDRVKAALPRISAGMPKGLALKPQFDQSLFVRAALEGVIREGVIASALTAMMILLFLGTWRNTLVVALSIPLSIFVSILCLAACGQTLNAMTLGGMALAVGILVDDATVEIENIDRNRHMGKPLVKAILDGAQQIAVPAFVSTLCICVVFLPIFFLTGVAKFLFTPLAMAVIFAMLASYFLSRTVVPTFVHHLLRHQPVPDEHGTGGDWIWRVHMRFNRHFERFRDFYLGRLGWCLAHRKLTAALMGLLIACSVAMVPFLGRDFFPLVDAGQFRLHVRAPAGTRMEETERIFSQVDAVIRKEIPPADLVTVLDNIGVPNGSTSLAFSDTVTVGPADGEILVSLNPEKKVSTWEYVRRIRARLRRDLPQCEFFTQPSDIVGQILNFGLPAPIDIQIAGRDRDAGYAAAQALAAQVAKVRGAVDVHVHQVVDAPYLFVQVDRTQAEQFGLSQQSVANNLLLSLSGSGATAPNYWLNPQNGASYPVVVQTPQTQMRSLDALNGVPIGTGSEGGGPHLLADVAKISRTTNPAVVNHYNIEPVFDVYANVDGRDLGGVATDIRKLLPGIRQQLPNSSIINMRGQVSSMEDAFYGLAVGVVFSVLLVYMLMVVNFQSWTDPFIIIMALPGALCGIIWMLFLTRTTLSVPSLMGAIMSVGVATANSILLVTFANDERHSGKNAVEAAMSAGFTRLRPVVMTALAMIIGMLPMSLGLGEGGEQNAPLGRAVIGGLLFATIATLLFVPVVYAVLRKKEGHRPEELLADEMHEQPLASTSAH
jgi:CzcA family heavy metal efflux pump